MNSSVEPRKILSVSFISHFQLNIGTRGDAGELGPVNYRAIINKYLASDTCMALDARYLLDYAESCTVTYPTI